MADGQDSDQEKTEEPTAHRIEEFRNKGEVASSKELTSVLVLAASVLTLTLSIVFIYEEMTEFMTWLYTLDAKTSFGKKAFKTIVYKASSTLLICAAPILAVTGLVGFFANVAQIGFLFSPDVLQLKPERVNPVEGIKRLFAMKSVVEAIKGFFKFLFVLAIVFYFLKDDMNTYQGFFHTELMGTFQHGKMIIAKLAMYIIMGLVVIAMADFAYQKFAYRKKLMMTKEEVKRENKEQEGSPEVKQKIRQIQREMSQKRMMSDVPKADVIVTNPTHISVALKYDRKTMVSPVVIAKGSDAVALKIREIANDYDIPIVENVPLARSMYKTVKINEAVPRSLYKAIAEVLAFVYRVKRKKTRGLGKIHG